MSNKERNILLCQEEISYTDRKQWYKKGSLHRDYDLPAIEYYDGQKEWWFEGKLHRESGAAVQYPDGRKDWYLAGKKYTEEEFNHIIEKQKLNEILDNDLEIGNYKKQEKI